MVNYSCSICDRKYGSGEDAENRAKECEAQGIIGPEIKPGILFSHKTVDSGFLIVYKDINRDKHQKTYLFEEVYGWSEDHISGIQDGLIKFSDLEKYLSSYNAATDEEVNFLNKKVNEEVPGIRGIKAYMEKFEIAKLHNSFDINEFLTHNSNGN